MRNRNQQNTPASTETRNRSIVTALLLACAAGLPNAACSSGGDDGGGGGGSTIAAPTAPTGLMTTVISDTQIDLMWMDTGTETGYEVDRSLNGTTWTRVATNGANDTSYSDGGLQPETAYFYRVRAFNAGGNSGYSASATATTEATATDPAVVNAIIDAAGSFQQLAGNSSTETPLPDEPDPNDPNFVLQKVVHDDVDNISSITYLGLNDDVLWPGALVRGRTSPTLTAHDFVYTPITAPRAPVTLSVNLTSPSGDPIAVTVDNPTLSTVSQGISDLLANADLSSPAIAEFSSEQMYSESQMSAFLDVRVDSGFGDLDTAFTFDENEVKTQIVTRYRQIYYTISMDTPAEPRFLFPADVNPDVLSATMPAGSEPLYIAGVSYGLMAISTVESDFSETAIQTSLDAAYDGLSLDLEVEAGMTRRQVLQNSSIRTVVYGGSTLGLPAISNGLNGLLEIIAASASYDPETSPGVPLVYRFRRVIDNNLALITQTSQYTEVRSLRVVQPVRLTAVSFTVTDADEADDDIEMDRMNMTASAFHDHTFNPNIMGLNPIGENTVVYNFATGGEEELSDNETWPCLGQNSWDIPFNTRDFNFDRGLITFNFSVREIDELIFKTDFDYASGSGAILGNQFLSSTGPLEPGVHEISVNGDFSGRFRYRIELIN